MSNQYVIILTTVDSEDKAEDLAKNLLKERLAACIQIQRTKSFYKWNEKMEHSDEYMLLIKTKSDLFSKLSEFIKSKHSYETPEIIQIPITAGSKEYLDWINASLE